MGEENNIEIVTETEIELGIVPSNDTKPETQPSYTLIMGDSPTHSVEWVCDLLQQVLAMNNLQALQIALTIHNEGKAVVFKGDWDAVVLKRDQVRSKGGDAMAKAIGVGSDDSIPVWIEEA